jgi:putative endopeptidase
MRTRYQDYIGNMLRLGGFSDPEARAKRVFELERKLAQAHWSTIDLRQVEKGYNPMTEAVLAAAAPGLDWGAFLKGAGLAGQARLNVGQPSALTGTAALVASEPLETWQDYLRLRTLQRYSSVLPKAFVETNFDFYGKILSGTPQLQERWKRAVNSANGSVGEGVGQLYVERYFPPEAMAKADRLVRDLIAAMDKRLANLTWMAPETKVKAPAKLAAFNPMIGYPERWTDYTPLRIVRGDAFGNMRRSVRFA